MTLKGKINSIRNHPIIIKDIMYGKKLDEIRTKVDKLEEAKAIKFISYLKQTLPYSIDPNHKPKLNRLCYIEDWKNNEIREVLFELQKLNPLGLIHRKDWEWALGIIAMLRFGKLNKNSTAIGIGVGTEPIPFYLANKLKHVYAT